jgi:hypothetical protein
VGSFNDEVGTRANMAPPRLISEMQHLPTLCSPDKTLRSLSLHGVTGCVAEQITWRSP